YIARLEKASGEYSRVNIGKDITLINCPIAVPPTNRLTRRKNGFLRSFALLNNAILNLIFQ
ncbi:hypothetical protein, partial [Providencia stuartii]|uniref:hypothetical protein n=2 Tax=Providencia TaxID=586 RepID=UPI002AA0E16E